MPELRIGTSGWSYTHWRGGVFYPEGMGPKRWLPYYAGHFDTVEVNGTFYKDPAPESVQNWVRLTPPHFLFAIKVSRYITHVKRLAPNEDSFERFETVARAFGNRLGPVLIQLPPFFIFDARRGQAFFERITALPWRYALEPRHPSWFETEPRRLLARYDIAWCIADSGRRAPRVEHVTADFVYLRFHGPGAGYGGSYRVSYLAEVARRVRTWQRKKLGVYAYFNNDAQGFAVSNAERLALLTGLRKPAIAKRPRRKPPLAKRPERAQPGLRAIFEGRARG